MRYVAYILLLVAITACAGKRALPVQEQVDVIRIVQTEPKQQIAVISDSEKVKTVVSLINSMQGGWSVPWYGAPVGKIYLELYKNQVYVGNFYIGSHFFGRDLDNFWSRPASKREVDELGAILGINLLYLIGSE